MRSLYAILCNIAFAASATAQSFNLGTASSFGVLAGSAVTNTGPTVIDGDLGLYPGTSHTGFTTSTPPGPGIVTGATNINDAVAMNALADALVAYNAASAMATTQGPTGMELGGLTLVPGVYEFDSTAQITGDLTLDASNDPTALFVFKIGSSLTTASNANVILLRGAQACNVIWRVGISATLGTDTEFNGIILASTSITATTGVNNFGSLFALNGAVTLDTNTITVDDTCNAAVSSSATPSSTTSTSTSSSSAVVSSSAGLSSSSVSSLSASASSSSAASSSSVGGVLTVTKTKTTIWTTYNHARHNFHTSSKHKTAAKAWPYHSHGHHHGGENGGNYWGSHSGNHRGHRSNGHDGGYGDHNGRGRGYGRSHGGHYGGAYRGNHGYY